MWEEEGAWGEDVEMNKSAKLIEENKNQSRPLVEEIGNAPSLSRSVVTDYAFRSWTFHIQTRKRKGIESGSKLKRFLKRSREGDEVLLGT